jgi:hypothetical protein
MEPRRLLQRSEKPANRPYPVTHKSSPLPSTLLPKDLFNTVLPSMLRSSEWSLPVKLSNQNVLRISFPHQRYMPAHLIVFDLIILIMFGEEVPHRIVFSSLLLNPS